jgi:hypothetical protein
MNCPKCASEISDINELLVSPLDNIEKCHWCVIVDEYSIEFRTEGNDDEAIHD